MEVLEKAKAMLEKYPLCDHCLGRQFALLGHGIENQERGRAIKTLLTMIGHHHALSKDSRGISLLKILATNGSFEIAAEILRKMKRRFKKGRSCFLCEDHFRDLSTLVDKIMKALHGYDYDTFLIGIRLPIEVEEREDEFKAEFEAFYSENMRNEFSRVIGKMFSKTTGKSVDFMTPNIAVVVNPFTEEIDLQANSLYIMGRYRKLVRGIPQSKWLCAKCRGRGCAYCNWTGKMYAESVEELIAEPIIERALGEEASFHGAGREDIDALMLGRGRPFVIEIKKPRKRMLDLSELEKAINQKAQGKIEVTNLKFANKEEVRKLKHMESSQKLYRVVVKFDKEVSDEDLEKLEKAFTDVTVLQRTPQRVLHRRADIAREKHIYETRVKRISQNSIEMRIQCQGGLYIKELITGDEGRTDPNVSKIVGAKADPIELDVLNVFIKGGGI